MFMFFAHRAQDRVGGRPIANDPIFEDPNRMRRMSFLGDGETQQRQTHADKGALSPSRISRTAAADRFLLFESIGHLFPNLTFYFQLLGQFKTSISPYALLNASIPVYDLSGDRPQRGERRCSRRRLNYCPSTATGKPAFDADKPAGADGARSR